MLLLAPLVMALAAPHSADRLFDAKGDSYLEEHGGKPLWSLMAGCAKGEFQKGSELEASPITASTEARAGTYGLTGEQMRARDLELIMTKVERYLTIAMETIVADRGVEVVVARDFIAEQLPQAQEIKGTMMGDPCVAIANKVRPA